MKAKTKAKRRVTLSICGLGILDESEADTMPGAVTVDVAHVEVKPDKPWLDEDHPAWPERGLQRELELHLRCRNSNQRYGGGFAFRSV